MQERAAGLENIPAADAAEPGPPGGGPGARRCPQPTQPRDAQVGWGPPWGERVP
jgi:hypothetical protein